MRNFLLIALLLTGCSHSSGSHHAHTHSTIPVAPFAGYVGTYQATLTQATGNYAGIDAIWTLTITGAGILTATNDHAQVVQYQLYRDNAGNLYTNTRALIGNNYEVGTAPAGLTELLLTARNGAQTLTGYAHFTVVYLGGPS